jgi:hypothetical protein
MNLSLDDGHLKHILRINSFITKQNIISSITSVKRILKGEQYHNLQFKLKQSNGRHDLYCSYNAYLHDLINIKKT